MLQGRRGTGGVAQVGGRNASPLVVAVHPTGRIRAHAQQCQRRLRTTSSPGSVLVTKMSSSSSSARPCGIQAQRSVRFRWATPAMALARLDAPPPARPAAARRALAQRVPRARRQEDDFDYVEFDDEEDWEDNVRAAARAATRHARRGATPRPPTDTHNRRTHVALAPPRRHRSGHAHRQRGGAHCVPGAACGGHRGGQADRPGAAGGWAGTARRSGECPRRLALGAPIGCTDRRRPRAPPAARACCCRRCSSRRAAAPAAGAGSAGAAAAPRRSSRTCTPPPQVAPADAPPGVVRTAVNAGLVLLVLGFAKSVLGVSAVFCVWGTACCW